MNKYKNVSSFAYNMGSQDGGGDRLIHDVRMRYLMGSNNWYTL